MDTSDDDCELSNGTFISQNFRETLDLFDLHFMLRKYNRERVMRENENYLFVIIKTIKKSS